MAWACHQALDAHANLLPLRSALCCFALLFSFFSFFPSFFKSSKAWIASQKALV